MALSLSSIISSVGESVQTARYAIEDRAVELYFKGGYEKKDEQLVPITKMISLPKTLGGKSARNSLAVPMTALYSHKTIALNKVDVNMRLKPCGQNDELLFKMSESNPQDDTDSGQYVDLSLSFILDDTPEGMARLNQENVKLL